MDIQGSETPLCLMAHQTSCTWTKFTTTVFVGLVSMAPSKTHSCQCSARQTSHGPRVHQIAHASIVPSYLYVLYDHGQSYVNAYGFLGGSICLHYLLLLFHHTVINQPCEYLFLHILRLIKRFIIITCKFKGQNYQQLFVAWQILHYKIADV